MYGFKKMSAPLTNSLNAVQATDLWSIKVFNWSESRITFTHEKDASKVDF